MTIFQLPDLGEGLAEAEVVSWHVGVGDHVVTDQPLVAVETDKAVVEIPSPRSGRVTKLCADVGSRLDVGDPLVEFEAADTQPDTGTVVGEVDAGPPAAMPTPVAAPSAVRATPAVRALARKRGVDLVSLSGSGPAGAITARDVERGAEALADAEEAEPLRGVRRAMADRMARAHAEVVPATVTDVADVECWSADAVVMLRLTRAVAAGCAAAPALNAWFNGTERSRRV
ncbi:MAG TPA: 2-oxo acid dehydrogenase subunit E2, partial [Acidobacteria bacterium]|nr:2-oxo acid dehydrogenase subunit E2 [Acidobacteriota bacterium]